MKKLLLSLCLAIASSGAIAGPNTPADIRWTQNLDFDPANGTTVRYLSVPAAGATCAAVLSGTTRMPHCFTLGTGLSVVNGVISAAQAQADWNAASGAAQILNKPTFATLAYSADWADLMNKPATWAPSPHTHLATDISDSWPLGRSVLTSPDAATARTVLGAVSTLDARLSDARTPLAHTHAIGDVTGLQSALDGKLSSITSVQVTTALGITPINQAGARSAISLTATGSGAATYNATTGIINVPTPATGTPFNFSLPVARTLAVSTSYQAADPTKAAIIVPSYACQNATTVLAASGCTLQVRMGTGPLTCSTGTVYYTQSLTVGLGLLLTQNSTNPVQINLPIGASFVICPTAGNFTITAVEQSAG